MFQIQRRELAHTEKIQVNMDRSALLSQCHSKLASKSAADAQAAILLLDSEDLKGDPTVRAFDLRLAAVACHSLNRLRPICHLFWLKGVLL